MLLLLRQIAQVLGRSASKDLTGWHSRTFGNYSSGRDDGEGRDSSTARDRSAHTDKAVIFESASIELDVGANLNILADSSLATSGAADASQILDCRVLTNGDRKSVTADNHTMPE